MYKIDFHTHSEVSPDGGISLKSYKKVLTSGKLDYVAITDHNRVDFALKAQKILGDKIIVGEEIKTRDGEIIGLYLKSVVKPGLSARQTIKEIKAQGGLVYIPHPFETVRKGIKEEKLDEIRDQVDIIEVFNGRAFFQNKSIEALAWAEANGVVGAASSDAHGKYGLSRTHTRLKEPPTRDNLLTLLKASTLEKKKPLVGMVLTPALNRIKKLI